MAGENVWYWPMAITNDGQHLFTYDSVFTLERAIEQFSIWDDYYCYRIAEAWVDCTDGTRIDCEKRWVVKSDA